MLLVLAIDASERGKREAIDVKIKSDIPFPMPCSVISSPIHMIRPVPAVMVRTIRIREIGDVSVKMFKVHFEPNKVPERATAINVVDCKMASAIVR